MSSKLTKVAQSINKFLKVTAKNPLTGASHEEFIHFIPFSAETSRKSAMYDRVAIASGDHTLSLGEVITIPSGDQYIVASITPDAFFNETTRVHVNLIHVFDTVSIIRVDSTKDTSTGRMTRVESVAYSKVPIGLRTVEFGIVKQSETLKETFYLLIPIVYTMQLEDILRFDTKPFNDFYASGYKPVESGIWTAYSVEARV